MKVAAGSLDVLRGNGNIPWADVYKLRTNEDEGHA
jgi:hypothetical protein